MEVITTYAPELLIYKLAGWPSLEEQQAVRQRLVTTGHLLEHSAALVDFRDVRDLPDEEELSLAMSRAISLGTGPQRIAYVITSPVQARFVADLQGIAGASRVLQSFYTEREALRWLFPSARDFPLSFLKD